MEIFTECMRNDGGCIAVRGYHSTKLCKVIVKRIIKCINGPSISGLLSLQILIEIVFSRPDLSTLCEDKNFIKNTVWAFIEFGHERGQPLGKKSYMNYWGKYFINVVFLRTSNSKLKNMILDVIIRKMKTGNSASMESGLSVLFGIVHCEVCVKEYDFGEGLTCNKKICDDRHNCDARCEVRGIREQNSIIFSRGKLSKIIFNKYRDHTPKNLDMSSKLLHLLKTLSSSHMGNALRLEQKKRDTTDEKAIQSRINAVREDVSKFTDEPPKSKPIRSGRYYYGESEVTSIGAVSTKEWGETGGKALLEKIAFESPLSKWYIGVNTMGRSMDLEHLAQSYIKGYRLSTSTMKNERDAFTGCSMASGDTAENIGALGARSKKLLISYGTGRVSSFLVEGSCFIGRIDEEGRDDVKRPEVMTPVV
jgi:hypothetical protein